MRKFLLSLLLLPGWGFAQSGTVTEVRGTTSDYLWACQQGEPVRVRGNFPAGGRVLLGQVGRSVSHPVVVVSSNPGTLIFTCPTHLRAGLYAVRMQMPDSEAFFEIVVQQPKARTQRLSNLPVYTLDLSVLAREMNHPPSGFVAFVGPVPYASNDQGLIHIPSEGMAPEVVFIERAGVRGVVAAGIGNPDGLTVISSRSTVLGMMSANLMLDLMIPDRIRYAWTMKFLENPLVSQAALEVRRVWARDPRSMRSPFVYPINLKVSMEPVRSLLSEAANPYRYRGKS